MEKPVSTLSKYELSKRIAGLSFGTRRVEVDPMQWHYRERAATRIEYDLDELQPPNSAGGDGAEGALQKVLAESTVVDTVDGRPAWRLRHDVRKATFKRLADQGRLVETLDANPARHRSVLQSMLDSYIRGNPPAIEAQTLSELEATLQVVEWLDGCLPALPDPNQLRRAIARERLLKPFRFLVGTHFRGRSEELHLLREYVGVLVHERKESAPPDLPLLIYGPGGIGKSTLIANFILEHADMQTSLRLPYVYIDFNRRDVDIQEPISILLEAVRQLAIHYPVDEKRWTELHEQWRRNLEDLALDSPAQKSAYEQESIASARRRGWYRYVSEFVDAVAGLLQARQPFLVVLDTFEELLFHNREYLGDLWDFLDFLRGEVPALRVVLSGRSTLPVEYPVQARLLNGLDDQAAVDLLLERGIPTETFARQIVEVVGRSPLSLHLAAELFKRQGGNMQAFEDLEARREYFYQVKEYLIQGLLYRRILGHIHDRDPRIQSLAHPGLVLRRVTPELILDVLAEGCQIEVKDIDDARTLFAQLRDEISIVEINQPDPNEVRQRPELRLAMLELLLQDDREKVKKIHHLAVTFFQNRVAAQSPADIRDRADLVYHRLALEEAPAFLDGYSLVEIQAIADELGSTIQDLPEGAQTYLVSRVKVDIQLDPGVWETADLKSWEQMTARSVQRQLNLRDYAAALEQLTKRSDRSLGSPLYALQVLAYVGLSQVEAARQMLEEGIRRTPPNSAEMQDLLLLAASIDERVERFAEAMGNYRRARHIALRLGNTTTAVNAQLDIVRLTHVLYAPEARESKEEYETLLQLWAKMDDETLLEHPYLLRDAATQVGAETPDLVKQAVRLLGLGSERPTNLNALASALASWDDLRSTELDQQPGALAQQVKAEWRGDLYSTWLGFLEETPWERAARDLAHLVEEHPLTPTMSITLVDLLSARLLLTNEQATLLQSLLVDSFTPTELDELLKSELDIGLSEVSRAKESERQVADLVSWVETNGRLVHLLQALVIARPENPQLRELLDLVGISTRSADEPANLEARFAADLLAAQEGQARYLRSGDIAGLDTALAAWQRIFDDASFVAANDRFRLTVYNNAGELLLRRYWASGRAADLSTAITLLQHAVDQSQPGSPDLPKYLNNLGNSLSNRYSLTGNPDDLQTAIGVYQRAVEQTQPGSPDLSIYLNNLGNSLSNRYSLTGNLDDLILAIAGYQWAVDRTQPGSPDLSIYLNNLGTGLRNRSMRTGNLDDLQFAIVSYQWAVEQTQPGSPNLPAYLNNLGTGLSTRYSLTGNLDDLQAAIASYQRAIDTTPSGSPDLPSRLNNLGTSLSNRYIRTGNLDDIQAAIGAYQQAVDQTQPGSPDLPSILNNLGNSLSARYSLTSEPVDLEAAIDVYRQVVDLTQPGSPDLPSRLNNLGTGLSNRFGRTGNIDDLQAAIGVYQRAVSLTQPGSPDLPIYLNNLGTGLSNRYIGGRNLDDLQAAIASYRQAIDATPPDSPDLPSYLNNLGTGLSTWYSLTGKLDDLQAAVDVYQRAVDITPSGSPDLPSYLNNFGYAYFQLGKYEDAAACYRTALGLAESAHDRNGIADAHYLLGFSHLELGQLDDAQRHLKTAEAIYADLNHPSLERVQLALKLAAERTQGEIQDTVNFGSDANVGGASGHYVGRDKTVQGNEVRGNTITVNVGASSRSVAIGKGSNIGVESDRGRLEQRLSAVCRGEVVLQNTPTYHTAFLVGPNLVLTAYHTVQEVVEGKLPPQNLTFRFDVVSTRSSEILSQGQAYALAVGREAQTNFNAEQPWLVATDAALDYALLRLARPAGEETVSGLRQSRPRGWLPLAEPGDFAPGDALGIFYFRQGAQLTANYQPRALLGFSEDGRRLIHQLETAPGASGAPILDDDLRVVGIHLGRGASEPPAADDLRRNAVFVPAVVDDLKTKGIWPLSAPFAF